ncbi:MAG TPA: cyclase family protein [Flavobacteriaceae bacterium]|nr:cyclase family protein [Flavobacteriaceae bacterium]MCB9214068.1 cyclase family protein [Alteromonas sp.]HPF11597.1 cyclase family protein [Flavobacteriaceae bacterium]HQU21815.1 cyclase family protein [Flavobacteriaceae bacterium]HQU65282.1 cyclase family protein [Flavobacteriaceae bacterium]
MKTQIAHKKKQYTIDLSKPLDISIPLTANAANPLAWYQDRPKMNPVVMGNWVGSVQKGASVNFNTITFNPHAHGTHTECVGHITKEFHSVQKSLKTSFFLAELISIAPENKKGDQVILANQVIKLLAGKKPEAVIIRTLPNTPAKRRRKYSNTNWPYLEEQVATFLREIGVKHLLIDLPSVDKEKDDGALLAHKAFWNYPNKTRLDATITEFIYVSNRIKDGSYFLDLQTAPFVNDATPSRPVLYAITKQQPS